MTKWISAVLIVAAAIVIGCGGEGTSDGGISATATTATATATTSTSTTSTSTTSGDSAFKGNFSGGFAGSNTTSATFSGTGDGKIQKNGDARFSFQALIDGVISYNRHFTGTVDDEGIFEGVTHTGEATEGTVVLTEGDILKATLVWHKRDAVDNHIIYTETEVFTLDREVEE